MAAEPGVGIPSKPSRSSSPLDTKPLGEILRRMSRQIVELQREVIGLKERVREVEARGR